MRRFMTHLAGLVLGLAAGAALVLGGLYFFPFPHLPRAERVLPAFGAGKEVEVLALGSRISGSGLVLSIAHGGKVPFAALPPGIRRMEEPAIRDGLALITRLRNERGEVVGIATELEAGHEDSSLLGGKLMTHTSWTVVLPGRGGLFLYQVEDNWWLATRIVAPAQLTGAPWQGHWRTLNTLGPLPNGHGRLLAATGEFAGRSGSFIETAEMREFTPAGTMDFSMEIRLALDRPALAAAGGEPSGDSE